MFPKLANAHKVSRYSHAYSKVLEFYKPYNKNIVVVYMRKVNTNEWVNMSHI